VTLISTGFIKDMSNMPTLSPSQRDILTANGESLKVAGKTIIEIQSDADPRFGFAFVLSGRNEPRVPSPHSHNMSHLLWDKTGQRVQAFHKHDIVDSLIDGDMRLRIKQARPINLNDAIRHAVELEAFNKAELNRNEGGGYLRSAAEQETFWFCLRPFGQKLTTCPFTPQP
jgi:hypothetical protein